MNIKKYLKKIFRKAETKEEKSRNVIFMGFFYLLVGFVSYVDWVNNNGGSIIELMNTYPGVMPFWVAGLIMVIYGVLWRHGVKGAVGWSRKHMGKYVMRFISLIYLVYVTNAILIMSKFQNFWDIPLAILLIISAFLIFLFSEYIKEW